MNDVKNLISSAALRVNDEIDRYLVSEDSDYLKLFDAMRYSALAPGKRIRPFLSIAFADALGANEEFVMPYACALEMIHC